MIISNNEILQKTSAKQVNTNQYQAICPAHNDKSPSLSINTSGNSPVLFCHAGCSYEQIIHALKTSVNTKNLINKKNREELNFNEKDLPGKRENNKDLILTYLNKTRKIKCNESHIANLYLRTANHTNFYIEIPFYCSSNSTVQVGAHLIFINEKGENLKRDGRNHKQSYGNLKESISKIGENFKTKDLHVCEGFEDAMIISTSLSVPVIPRFGTSGIKNFEINPFSGALYIWADNDNPGQTSAQELYNKAKMSNSTYIVTPTIKKDWLDEELHSIGAIEESYFKIKFSDWNQPLKITSGHPKIDRYDSVNCHPLILNFAKEESEISDTHQDLFISAVVVAMSGFISRIYEIQPNKAITSYTESSNIWGMNVDVPGSKKSHAQKTGFTKLLSTVSECLREKELQNKNIFLERNKALVQSEKKLTKAESCKNTTIEELKQLQEKMEKLKIQKNENPLKLLALILNDTTTAAFINRSSFTNENIMLIFDELNGLFGSFRNQFKTDSRAVYLQSWNGKDTYKKETKLGGSEYVKRLSATIFGSIQPSVLTQILNNSFNTIEDDGFIQRFQVVVFPDYHQKIKQKLDFNPSYRNTLKDIYLKLYSQYTNHRCPQTILIDEKAEVYLTKIKSLNNHINVKDKKDEIINSYNAKLPKLFLSIALLFELIEQREELDRFKVITGKSAKLAFNFCMKNNEYIQKMLFKTINPDTFKASLIIDKILSKDIRNNMSPRQIYRKGWKDLKDQKDVYSALAYLESVNWLKLVEVDSPSGYGRKSEVIKFNPYLIEYGVKNYIEG